MNNAVHYALISLCMLLFSSIQSNALIKPMKILMVVARFPKIHDICMLNQMTGLINRGHDVWIYSEKRGDTVNVQQEVISYNLIDKTMFYLPDSLDDYDIVLFQLGHKVLDIRKTHGYKGKIVVCLRGYDVTAFLQQYPHAYDEYFKSCDLFLPVCDFFKHILLDHGCEPRKIIVHHSAIDCSKFRFKERLVPHKKNLTIISVGRFIEKKGFHYSILAVAHLIKKYPFIRYIIIGDGPLKNDYKKLIRQLGLVSKIKLDDWHAHDEYIQILNEAHLFIHPSVVATNNDQEGIPNVLKEAMALGIIVVATNHAGNSELIIDKVSGFLVPERDMEAICRVVEYILEHSEIWRPMQQAALQKIQREFETERENDKLETILYNLLQQ
jgi:colanic acid/amylovoran biosynthesis glycosyltransferase